MAIAYVQFPPRYAAAFNPIILVVQTPSARYAQLEKDFAAATTDAERNRIKYKIAAIAPYKDQTTLDPLKVLVVIGDNTANREVVIEREPDFEGKAEIDLSFIMRHAFINVKRSEHPFVEHDYNLMASYVLIEGDEQVFDGCVINAVEQLGRATGGDMTGFVKLTRTPMIRYPGYPLGVTFRQIPDMHYLIRLANDDYYWGDYLPTTIGNVYVAGEEFDFDDIMILTEMMKPVTMYKVKTGCVPDYPFFVRWINARGGWDYHMFERREKTAEVGDISTVQRVATDPNDTQTTVSISAAETVTVGEGLLEQGDYLILSALARSPRIEWFNEEIKAWQVIVLSEDFSASWNARSGFGSVEFTFSLPRILTQF